MTGGRGASLAALPMYDLPELREATDALWAAWRDALRERGFAAPETLSRGGDLATVWRSPALVLAQTCGLPFAWHLRDRVTLIGAPDYAGGGDPPGHYHSVLVARADDARDLDALCRGRFAANGRDSQSGWNAALADGGRLPGGRFGAVVVTGAHRLSVAAVREGRADLAAIDRVTWGLLCRNTGETEGLCIVARTPPTPGLPLIAAPQHDAAVLVDAVEAGLRALAPAARDALGIAGFVRFRPADYDALLKPSFPAAPAR